jgi:hypothetical protein
MFLEKFGRIPECGYGFRASLLPSPLPDRIEMSIADEMKGWFFQYYSPAGKVLYQVKYRTIPSIKAPAPHPSA